MIKSKRQMYIIIGVFMLVLVLFTTTYAFFNYTRTGTSNTIRVGRISFVSKNEQTITLNNLFPIDPSNTTDMNDDTKVGTYSIDIKGDTDYVDGIEYLVSVVDANIYTNEGQIIPISLDVTVDDLGTSTANYFTARESKDTAIYKKIVGDTLVGDQMLLVGYIPQNNPTGTADGVDGSITIKAYLDKNNILISDTYDGTESDPMGTTNNQANGKTIFTTSEWNAAQSAGISFKVRVEANEGIWVNGSLEEIMKKSAVMDNVSSTYVSASSGINFAQVSSDTNGKGVYMRAGTENDAYPIMYYRGAVEDNNVKFNNKCWKIVRTTDTGGVKLIYNGIPTIMREYNNRISKNDYLNYDTNSSTVNFEYDESISAWKSSFSGAGTADIKFSLSSGHYYVYFTSVAWVTPEFKKNNVNLRSGGGRSSYEIYFDATNSDQFEFKFQSSLAIDSMYNETIIYLIKGEDTSNVTCNNNGNASLLVVDNQYLHPYNVNSNSPAYIGYMYGDTYESSYSNWTTNARFGSSYTWDGTNYTLIDDSVTVPDSTHHYSCNSTTEHASCASIRYTFNESKHYVILTNGIRIEDAINKTKNNTNNSNAKSIIDTWYANNMSNLTNKLEDTIWCNDRTVSPDTTWTDNANMESLHYSPFYRFYTLKQPSFDCIDKNDSFTVKNSSGNKKLTYPSALLTFDELMLVGIDQSFLYSNNILWTMSPYVPAANAEIGTVSFSSFTSTVSNNAGIRPVISLKPGQLITKGSGTAVDPYVIE